MAQIEPRAAQSRRPAYAAFASLVLLLAAATPITGAMAESGPMIRETQQRFGAPTRSQTAQSVQTPSYAAPSGRGLIPTIFRSREPQYAPRALGFAPIPSLPPQPRYLPRSNEAPSTRETAPLPNGAIGDTQRPRGDQRNLRPNRDGLDVLDRARSRARQSVRDTAPKWGIGQGISTATNYCVRLCDGYAFPIGNAESGSFDAQEAACRLACPSADTALFSAPAGALDLNDARRGSLLYSQLPNAFRYREKYDAACTCRGKGETQSSAALLTDFTLRKGDLAMTKIGMRHFDGTERFPYRQNVFSDALAKVTDKREVQIIRGMEAASLRGNLPVTVHASVKARVISEIRTAETVAARSAPREARPVLKSGFEELRRSRQQGPLPVRQVERRRGIVAMN